MPRRTRIYERHPGHRLRSRYHATVRRRTTPPGNGTCPIFRNRSGTAPKASRESIREPKSASSRTAARPKDGAGNRRPQKRPSGGGIRRTVGRPRNSKRQDAAGGDGRSSRQQPGTKQPRRCPRPNRTAPLRPQRRKGNDLAAMSPEPRNGAPGERTYKRRKMSGKHREQTSPTSAKNGRYAETGTCEKQNGDQYKDRRMSVPSPAACNSENKDARIQLSTHQCGKKRAAATTRNGNTGRKNFIG